MVSSLLPSWLGGQAQPLLSLCPWDRTPWSQCHLPCEPFVLVKQAVSVPLSLFSHKADSCESETMGTDLVFKIVLKL